MIKTGGVRVNTTSSLAGGCVAVSGTIVVVNNNELSRCATEIDAMIAEANYPSFNKHSKRNKSDRKRNKHDRWR